MKNMKRLLTLILALCIVMGMVACSGGKDASSTADQSSASDESKASEPESTSSASEESAAEDGKTLVYWSMWNSTEPQAAVIQEAIAAYEEQTGNTVQVEWKGRDIASVIQAALEGGETIDLFDEDFMRMSKNYAKNLADLESMAAEVEYDSYAVAALPAAVRGWSGNLSCIPYQPYTSGIFYDKAAFEKAGVTAEPQTWEEFLDACQKLKDAGYIPLAQDDAYALYTLGYQLARYMTQEGVSKLVTEWTWSGSPEALKAANDIAQLRELGYLSDTAPDAYPAGENEIGFGNAAMVVNASWVPGEITNNTGCDIEWGMFNYPTVAGGKDPSTIANVGAQALGIPSNSQNSQEAFDLIMMITSGEYDQKMALESNGIPADTRNSEWPEMIAGCRDAFNALTNVYDWNCGLNDNGDMSEIMQEGAAKLFNGTYTGQQFIDAMDEAGQ